MKNTITMTLILATGLSGMAYGQQKSLASTMDVFVFPESGQEAAQQSQDEAGCYNWATQQTGNDPFDLQKEAEKIEASGDQAQAQADASKQQAQGAGAGAGAQGAVGGAAAGALVGAIAGDAGKGAAIGAGVGLVSGRRRGRQAQSQATQQAEAQGDKAEQQTQQAMAVTDEQLLNFKKAFSVCLEAKDYLVKY
jgi:hypothetical protein